jgi:hypothetical protein
MNRPARLPVGDRGSTLQRRPFPDLDLRNRIAVHLVRPIDDAHGALVGIGLGEREVAADAGRAVRLDRQSTTLHETFGATTLIIAISARAALLPATSIIFAAFSVSSRAWSIMQRLSAMRSCQIDCSDRGLPNAVRATSRSIIISSARSAAPMDRMQWWMRPGPRRPCAISKPRPSPSRMFATGTRTFSSTTSMWPCGAPRWRATPAGARTSPTCYPTTSGTTPFSPAKQQRPGVNQTGCEAYNKPLDKTICTFAIAVLGTVAKSK